jgi:hypothetical protein
MKLTVSHIHGVDAFCPAPQQYLRETAGRRADIERHPTQRIEAESVERRRQLQTAARNIAAPILGDGDLRARR